MNWMRLHRGAPQRCFCGHWFQLVDTLEQYQLIPMQKEDLQIEKWLHYNGFDYHDASVSRIAEDMRKERLRIQEKESVSEADKPIKSVL